MQRSEIVTWLKVFSQSFPPFGYFCSQPSHCSYQNKTPISQTTLNKLKPDFLPVLKQQTGFYNPREAVSLCAVQIVIFALTTFTCLTLQSQTVGSLQQCRLMCSLLSNVKVVLKVMLIRSFVLSRMFLRLITFAMRLSIAPLAISGSDRWKWVKSAVMSLGELDSCPDAQDGEKERRAGSSREVEVGKTLALHAEEHVQLTLGMFRYLLQRLHMGKKEKSNLSALTAFDWSKESGLGLTLANMRKVHLHMIRHTPLCESISKRLEDFVCLFVCFM